jgi:hypothetical protein
MRKAYLFVFNNALGEMDNVLEFLDKKSEILNWRRDLPNAVYLISESTAGELAKIVREYSQDKGNFLITEVTANKQGWLPKSTWKFLNEKHDPE